MLGAEILWEKVKARRESILLDLEDGEGLEAEYLSPAGNIILIRDFGHYTDTDDLIFLVGVDAKSGEECQVIAPPHIVQIVFRITKEANRPDIGFHKDRLPKEEKGP